MTHHVAPDHAALLAPAVVLEFSDDLRSADVGPLQDFLAARLGEIARAQPEGTDARWAAEHLARTIDADCRDLDDALVSWEVELTEGDINQVGLVQTLRQSLPTDWNRLVEVAQRFAGHPGHLPRWRHLRYSCAEHAEFVEQRTGDASDGGILHQNEA
ncbi:hypothetical protein PZ61_0238045 [Streptomyces sp. MNU77]|uniref:hypothetical protein n=1 Tax=Streptomyces sp. MNU77 TaxID=1573406 RepID=UPI0005DD228E|nr:hypothetical protein [Streptomyces sp. MNU77]OLO25486.1 hypothetical protein PZ61_0238045 [Streptomyces sp. MNU77]